MLGFFLTLLLPTVLLNGAFWGQCDSIYGALAVWSLVFALEDRPIRSVLAAAQKDVMPLTSSTGYPSASR